MRTAQSFTSRYAREKSWAFLQSRLLRSLFPALIFSSFFAVNAAAGVLPMITLTPDLLCPGEYVPINCTSNDVSIASITADPSVQECIEGQDFDVTLTATIVLNSEAARRDVGIWISQDENDPTNDTPGDTSMCSVGTFPVTGVDFFGNAPDENPADDCGDALKGAKGEQVVVDLGMITLPCLQDENGDLVIQPVITWVISKTFECSGPTTVRPGSQKSKCEADSQILPITVKQAPKLTIVKEVVNNNGGNAVVGDFSITTNAGALSFDGGTTNNDTTTYTATTLENLTAGTFSLVEIDVDGYTEGSWGCTAGTGLVATFDNGSITLAAGDDAVCTISNDDIAPQLTIIKDPTNDDSGTAIPDDFLLTVDGDPVNSGDANDYLANTALVINETQVDGYTFVEISGDAKCPIVLGGTITLDEGDDITCTIVNNDLAVEDETARLTIEKEVVNNNGGNAVVSDFFITTSAGGLNFDGGVIDNNTTTYTATTLVVTVPGSFTLVEIDVDGYTEGSWGCTAGTGLVTTFDSGSITLAADDDVTCTISNDDIAPKLTIIKDPTNDDSGTANPDDFLLTVDGDPVKSGDINVYLANTPLTINETQVDGYTFVEITGDAKCPGALGGTITLDEGDDITCTIVNDDDVPLFFEGIPTLNQYGLALLALLMLGIGVIGFRRFS